MNRNEIIMKVKELIGPYVNDNTLLEEFDMETNFIKDLDIHSAHFIDIILDFEDHFEVLIDDETATKMNTVGEAVEAIEKLLVTI